MTRLLVGNLVVGAGYYGLAKLGSVVQFTGGAQVAWLPVGFAAALLYLGDMRWVAGAVIADLLLGTGFPPDFGTFTHWTQLQTLGNVVEITLAAYLMRRWLGPRNRLERPVDIAWLLLAIGCAAAVSAAVGTLTTWADGDIASGDLASVFRTWWLGDTSGGLLVVPLILVWASGPPVTRPPVRRALEITTILTAVVVLSLLVFDSTHAVTYVIFPALFLAALNL